MRIIFLLLTLSISSYGQGPGADAESPIGKRLGVKTSTAAAKLVEYSDEKLSFRYPDHLLVTRSTYPSYGSYRWWISSDDSGSFYWTTFQLRITEQYGPPKTADWTPLTEYKAHYSDGEKTPPAIITIGDADCLFWEDIETGYGDPDATNKRITPNYICQPKTGGIFRISENDHDSENPFAKNPKREPFPEREELFYLSEKWENYKRWTSKTILDSLKFY